MDKITIEKKVYELAGNYLLPADTTIKALKLGLPDVLIFKEWIDIEFGDIFDIAKITDCDTIGELTSYVVNTVVADDKENAPPHHAITIPENVGFLILELSANDTAEISWEDLPDNIRKLFKKVMNAGIKPSASSITHKEDLYMLSFMDADQDFSALYIIYQGEVICISEN